jgi:hypothetical protein
MVVFTVARHRRGEAPIEKQQIQGQYEPDK